MLHCLLVEHHSRTVGLLNLTDSGGIRPNSDVVLTVSAFDQWSFAFIRERETLKISQRTTHERTHTQADVNSLYTAFGML